MHERECRIPPSPGLGLSDAAYSAARAASRQALQAELVKETVKGTAVIVPGGDVAVLAIELVDGELIEAAMTMLSVVGIGKPLKAVRTIQRIAELRARLERIVPYVTPPAQIGFASPRARADHLSRHIAEFERDVSPEAYEELGRTLLSNMPMGREILGHVNRRGDVLRFDVKSGTFAAMQPNGTILTIFKPQGGVHAWPKIRDRY